MTRRCGGRRRGPCTRRGELVEGFRFNVMIARVMELVNATRKAIDSGAARPTRRSARRPRRSRSCCPWWRRTPPRRCGAAGPRATVARVSWPASTRRCWSSDSVTAVVQVQGKVRARLEVSPDIAAAELEELALADAAVVEAIDGREVRRVIVRSRRWSTSSSEPLLGR